MLLTNWQVLPQAEPVKTPGSVIQIPITKETVSRILDRLETIETNHEYEILSLPLGFGPPPRRFFEAGGVQNPISSQVETLLTDGKEPMLCYTRNFEEMEHSIEGKTYRGFELWNKVYEAFPDYRDMTEQQARKQGIYPTIYYYTRAAWEWMAQYHWGRLAELNLVPDLSVYRLSGELPDILTASNGTWRTLTERLAAFNQAPTGWCSMTEMGPKIHDVGRRAFFVSGSERIGPHKLVSAVEVCSDSDMRGTWLIETSAFASHIVVISVKKDSPVKVTKDHPVHEPLQVTKDLPVKEALPV